MRPVTRRTTCVKLPRPCIACGGGVYAGMEGFDGPACASCQKPVATALPDGYPISVTAPYGQPARLVKTLPDGDVFVTDRMAGWCACGRGERLNYGTRVVKRGPFLWMPSCDPHPSINHCPCGVAVTGSDVLCDYCWSVWHEMIYEWPRVREAPVKMAFGKTTDGTPLQAPHLAMRDHLKRAAR